MPSPPTTTSVSTPSATHWRARSRASSASRPTRLRTTDPASRSRGTARARLGPSPLAGRGVGEKRDLPGHARTLVLAPSRGRSRTEEHCGSAHGARRGDLPVAARTSRAARWSSTLPGRARVSRRRTVRSSSTCRAPRLVRSACGLLVDDRASGRPRSTASRSQACRRAVGTRAAARRLASRCGLTSSEVQVTSRSPSQSGRSKASSGVIRAARPSSSVELGRRASAAAAPAVEQPGDHLGDHEQQQHRHRQHQHRERVGRRRRDGREDEGPDDDPGPVAARATCRRPRRRG